VAPHPLSDPYAPPAASLADAPLDIVSAYIKAMALAFPIGAVVGLGIGCLQYLQAAFGLRRFGGMEYVPRIVGLAMTRSWGPSCAVLIASLTAVVTLHRAGRRASGPITIAHARVYLVAAAYPLLYVVIATLGLLGALLAWLAESSWTTNEFFTYLSETLTWSDIAYGLATAAVSGLLVTWLLQRGANWLIAKKRGIVVKLVVGYSVVQVFLLVYWLFVGIVTAEQ